MSQDFKPIDHILANISLKREGKIDRYMMETPQLEFVMPDGTRELLCDPVSCEKWPYVTYLCPPLANLNKEYGNNPSYVHNMDRIEAAFREVTVKAAEAFEQAQKPSPSVKKVIDLTKAFDNIDADIKLMVYYYTMGFHEYEFSYDSGPSQKLFCEKFLDMFDINKETQKDDDLEV